MKRRAIFFGVDDYANIPMLDCAVADAAALCVFPCSRDSSGNRYSENFDGTFSRDD